jgi:hypothetical protein
MARRAAQEEGTEDVQALKERIAQLECGQQVGSDEGGWEAKVRERQKDAARAQALEAAARRDPAIRSGAKKLPPISARARNFHNDPTVVRGKDGKPADLEPGFHYMWVPEINQDLTKGAQFVGRYGGYGYVRVEDPNTPGEPYRWNENILMRLPDEDKADLVMAMSPTQGMKADDYFAAQAEAALNSYADMQASSAGLIRSKRSESIDEE